MIRDLAIFTLRCVIALTAIAWFASAVIAQRVEFQCRPVIAPPARCDPAALSYNPAPLECHRA